MHPHHNIKLPSPAPEPPPIARVTTTHNHLTRLRRSSLPTKRLQKRFASRIKIFDSRHIENSNIEFLRLINKPRSVNQHRPIQVVGNKATLCQGPLRELCQPPPDVRCGHKKPATDCFPQKRRSTREFRPSRGVRFGRNRMQRNTVPRD